MASHAAKNSFSWWWISDTVTAEVAEVATSSQIHFIMAMMKIERYYSSLKEDRSPITPNALTVIDRQDYVTFFKACGPNFVRGIRRAQEVTAIFRYESNSEEASSEYAQLVGKNYGYNRDQFNDPRFISINQSLSISIKAYGLGLTEQGSESLVARTLEDFNKVMRFAYNQLTKSPFANHVGMVYGIEVAPWAEHVEFQVASRLSDEAIDIPLPKSLIPLAILLSTATAGTVFANDEATRLQFTCKESTYSIDKYGYCCEPSDLYDYNTGAYSPLNPELRVCRPIRSLDVSVIKDNVVANGEFVARLDSTLRYKMNMMSVLERCISAVNAIPTTQNHFFLKSQDSVKYDKSLDNVFTVFDMKMSIDPFDDFGVLLQIAKEVDEYVEMYYSPCLAAIFGTNIGTSSTTEPSYFKAYPWYTHSECNDVSCLVFGNRWDRENGGCTPGIINGDRGYTTNNCDDETSDTCKCARDENNDCKTKTSEVSSYTEKLKTCWTNVLPSGQVSYFVEHFCMPSVTNKALDEEAKTFMDEQIAAHCPVV